MVAILSVCSHSEAVEYSDISIVYEEPDIESCEFLGEITDFDFEMALNDRRFQSGKIIAGENTSYYRAKKMNGNVVYVRSIQLGDGDIPPAAYTDKVISVSHGSDYYFINPRVYYCGRNS